LHTNDAPSTVTRMIDMGIEPFNVASAVNLIVAQRLVRRVCSECKQEHTYTAEEIHAFGIAPAEAAKLTFYKGAGCDTCGGSGYKGRQGLYEVMAMTSAARRMVLKGGSTEELREQAVKDGMLTLRMDGMLKVKRGITTLEDGESAHPARGDDRAGRVGPAHRGGRASQAARGRGHRELLGGGGAHAQGHAVDRLFGAHREPEEAVRDRERARFLVRDPEPGAVPRQLLQAARLRIARDPADPLQCADVRGAGTTGRRGEAGRAAPRPGARDGAHGVGQEYHACGVDRQDQQGAEGAYHHGGGPDRVHPPPPELHREPARDRDRHQQLRRRTQVRAAAGS